MSDISYFKFKCLIIEYKLQNDIELNEEEQIIVDMLESKFVSDAVNAFKNIAQEFNNCFAEVMQENNPQKIFESIEIKLTDEQKELLKNYVDNINYEEELEERHNIDGVSIVKEADKDG